MVDELYKEWCEKKGGVFKISNHEVIRCTIPSLVKVKENIEDFKKFVEEYKDKMEEKQIILESVAHGESKSGHAYVSFTKNKGKEEYKQEVYIHDTKPSPDMVKKTLEKIEEIRKETDEFMERMRKRIDEMFEVGI
jgi:uncharacterized protein YeaO (DUF488 family)